MSVDVLLAQLVRVLPAEYLPLRPVLAGIAAMLNAASVSVEDLVTATTANGAEDVWLRLFSAGYGVYPATSESDASLRDRLLHYDDQLTVAAILAVVNAILAPYTSGLATIHEHFRDHFVADLSAADIDRIYDQRHAFTLMVPQVGEPYSGVAFADLAAADLMAVGTGDGWHPVYAAIVAVVNRIRAGGVRWWLVLDAVLPLGEAIRAVAPFPLQLLTSDSGIEAAGLTVTAWRDSSGNGNDAAVALNGANRTFEADGDGYCVDFEGSSLRTAGNVALAGDITVIAVFRDDGIASEEEVYASQYSSGFWLGHLGYNAQWGGGFLESSPPFGQYVTCPAGVRTMLAIRRAGTQHDLIKDGVVVASKTASAGALNTMPIGVGADGNGNFGATGFRGYVFAVWNRALADAEIAAITKILQAHIGLN